MKPYLISLGAGLLVGIVYALLNVRSPAPPVIALVGLLGILVGEQVVPVTTAWISTQCGPPVLGQLPAAPKPDCVEPAKPGNGPGSGGAP